MPSSLFCLLTLQALLGAFDNLWHHELQARLFQRPHSRRELALHVARESLYAVLFFVVAWLECRGVWAWLMGAMLAAEIVITLADFLEEDRTRKLPRLERVLHAALTAGFGAVACLLAPVLVAWSRQPTELVLVSHGPVSWLFSAFVVGVLAWTLRNVMALRSTRHLAHAASAGIPAHLAGAAGTVLVTGGTGFIGRALVADLVRGDRRVMVLSRDLLTARGLLGPQVLVIDRLDTLPVETRIDAIVHLAGSRVLGLPWTRGRRRDLVTSRVSLIVELAALMGRLERRPAVLVTASATGWYGVPGGRGSMRGEGIVPLDETATPRPGQFASDLCASLEHETRRAEALGVRVVRLRLGVVLGRGDGAWPLQAMAARLGLAAMLGSGQQPVPWIHLDDAVGLIRFSLAHAAVAGALNAVAPEVPRQRDFALAMAAAYARRAWLRIPAAPLRWLGGEMMSLLLEGQSVAPAAALAAGYRFRFPRLAPACASLAGRPMPSAPPSGSVPAVRR